jgi:hypothetical protein
MSNDGRSYRLLSDDAWSGAVRSCSITQKMQERGRFFSGEECGLPTHVKPVPSPMKIAIPTRQTAHELMCGKLRDMQGEYFLPVKFSSLRDVSCA